MKAQNLGTTPQPRDSELAGHLGSLTSALDSEQSQWEKDNPPENYNPEEFREAIKSWPKRSATPEPSPAL